MVRQGLRAVLDGAVDVEVVGDAGYGLEAGRTVVDLRPDVVLLDLQMPELHGIEATRRIAARCPGTAVLVLTMFEDDDTVVAAVAAGYLPQGRRRGRHPHRRAGGGPGAVPRPDGPGAGNPRPPDGGLTNAEIRDRVHLSDKTVANNVSTILTKLHLTSGRRRS